MSFDYDLFVIGGGSGGVRAARIAASQHGARVALAEESRMGGTCVIRGCVPKKLMVFASGAPAAAAEARGYGWPDARAGRFDWPEFRAKLDADLTRLEGLYENGLAAAGVDIFHDRAKLADAHMVELADGRRFSARHILIAVGGRPSRPGIPGDELGMISDDLFTMESVPSRVLVVGGGFIACEFATILQGLGADTTLSYRGDLVLRGFDAESRRLVTHQLEHIGVNVRLHTNPARLDRDGEGVCVTFEDGTTARIGFECGLVDNCLPFGSFAAGVLCDHLPNLRESTAHCLPDFLYRFGLCRHDRELGAGRQLEADKALDRVVLHREHCHHAVGCPAPLPCRASRDPGMSFIRHVSDLLQTQYGDQSNFVNQSNLRNVHKSGEVHV